MKISRLFLTLLLPLACSTVSIVRAQVPFSGIPADPDCGGIADVQADRAELYSIKVSTSGSCRDMLFDTRYTGGLAVGGATVGDPINPSWLLPPNWSVPQVGTDVAFTIITFPPVSGQQACRALIDSGSIVNQDFSAAIVQTVGDSLPIGFVGTQSIDLVLPGTSAQYSVRLAGQSSIPSPNFPRRASGCVEVAFAPLSEVNTTDFIGGCSPAGEYGNPADPDRAWGVIVGYNVYRVEGTSAMVPTRQQFFDASLNADDSDGWQYYMPLTSSYRPREVNPDLADPDPLGRDLFPNDLGGLQNPDAVMYSGDEVMIFQDSASNRGEMRISGTGADLTGATSYWYAFQPVLCGTIDSFSSGGFGPGQSLLAGDHRLDMDSDGTNDAVDLDLDGDLEFFSPQAEVASQPGLGLTHDGLPLLSAPVFGFVNPLPSTGGITLAGTATGSRVDLQILASLEATDVVGYNVYRIDGLAQVRVNDRIVLAEGLESGIYSLVDSLTANRRLRQATASYMIEIVHDGGYTEMVGPFEVTLGRAAGAEAGRRRR